MFGFVPLDPVSFIPAEGICPGSMLKVEEDGFPVLDIISDPMGANGLGRPSSPLAGFKTTLESRRFNHDLSEKIESFRLMLRMDKSNERKSLPMVGLLPELEFDRLDMAEFISIGEEEVTRLEFPEFPPPLKKVTYRKTRTTAATANIIMFFIFPRILIF